MKVSPMKWVMRFGKKDCLRYIGPFEHLECVLPVAYLFSLPPNICGVLVVFHVSIFKSYNGDEHHIIKWD